MGTINYFTSDYITLGIKPYDYSDFENDAEILQDAKEQAALNGTTVEDELCDTIQYYYECTYYNVSAELKKHYFHYFHIAIKPGYYEGFTIEIEFNYGICLDSWKDKRDAQKEITKIKKFLKTCTGMGMVACYPGWRTGYCDYKETLKEISRAIKEMQQVVKDTPTWNQYYGQCA